MKRSILRMPALALLASTAILSSAGESEWPQYCGANRDSNVLSSPKLLDAWPKEGPPLAWKSDLIPGWLQGGCAGPAVAEGKVFVYATAKNPIGGGNVFKLVTPEVLAAAGWMADVPPDLAKKVEDARTLKGRPNCDGWIWVEVVDPKEKEKDLDAFLAKKPELDKYIKDFLATLKPDEVSKYGSFVKYRLCMSPTPQRGKGTRTGIVWDAGTLTWDQVVALSKLQGEGYPTLREWAAPWRKATNLGTLNDHLGIGGYFPGFFYAAWWHAFTRTDALTCLDAATGKTLWKKEFPVDAEIQSKLNINGGTHNPAAYLGCCGTPAIADGKCYFGGLMGLYCLATKDGALLWQVKRLSSNTSVLVANGIIYYCGAAYEAASGKQLWTTPLYKDGEIAWNNNTTPSFWKSGGRTYVISGNGADSIICLDLETGKNGWSLKVKNFSGFGPCNFTVRNDCDILIADNKTFHMTPTELQPLKTLEETVSRSGFNPGVMSQDLYYAETTGGEGGALKLEGLCCWDYKTGDLKWSGPHIETIFCAPPILADGKMIVANGVGGQEGMIFNNWKVMMIKATPEKYLPMATFAPGMIPWTPMAFAGGKLFVRTETGISCYDLEQHGPYLDKTVVTKDSVTFVFKQTGGGLKDGNLKDVVLTDAKGAAKPAKAAVAGETIVVDIKDIPVPFGISCAATHSLTANDGKPLPAFSWSEAHALKFRTCFDNTIVLTSDALLPPNGTWNKGATYVVSGATVTSAKPDAFSKTVTLTTDKPFKAGDSITLTYPHFPVDQGEPQRETLTFNARENTSAKFIKVDEATSGNWKGVYGAEGALVAGEAAATVKCAVVAPSGHEPGVWAKTTEDARAPQKPGETKERVAASWSIRSPSSYFKIDVEVTDGKEHQVALYCLDWDKPGGGRAMTVEVWDPWKNIELAEKQTVKEFGNGKYLVWNVKGHVELRLQSTGQWCHAIASGVFFDAPK